jgi:hypothetical protein
MRNKKAKAVNETLWSLQEKREYTRENATIKVINNVSILTTPRGEPLVLKVR